MFCNTCGAEIQPQFNVCPNCGRPIASVAGAVFSSRLTRHLRTLGTLWIVLGALLLAPSFVMMVLSGVVHVAVPATEVVGKTVAPVFLSIIGGWLLVLAAGAIAVGWGLQKHEPWARIVAIVVGILLLFHPPFGTALGIYTLWVLLGDEGGAEYYRLARAV